MHSTGEDGSGGRVALRWAVGAFRGERLGVTIRLI